jgi:hypothetical protein
MAYISKYSGEDIDLRLDLINKLTPRNLLDNSDFRNPVNQRGQTTCDKNGYWIDRWKHSNIAYLDIKDGCIGINATGSTIGGLTQVIADASLYDGKKLTLAVCAKSAGAGKIRVSMPYVGEKQNVQLSSDWAVYTYTATFKVNNYNMVGVYAESGSAIDVKWAALYEGEYTAETLPEYQSKGYGAELAECRRYYQRYGGEAYTKFGFGVAVSASNARVLMPILPMRITKPSCNSVGVFALDPGDNIYEVAQINLDEPSYGGLYACLSVSISGDQLIPRNVVLLQARDSASSYIELSADL